MRFDARDALRGAAAGAFATGVWALQQGVDKRVFGSRYDDVEVLGKLVTRGPRWRAIGTAIHLANGALFGASYVVVARGLPGPGWAKGIAAACTENVILWPLSAITDRVHPARDELPALFGDPAAFAQATWRHVLFGAILGELEQRWNR